MKINFLLNGILNADWEIWQDIVIIALIALIAVFFVLIILYAIRKNKRMKQQDSRTETSPNLTEYREK